MLQLLLSLLISQSYASDIYVGTPVDGGFIVQAAIAVLTSLGDDRYIEQTTIKGTCKFEGSSCSGASVELLGSNGKILKRSVLVGSDGFTFTGLEKYAKHSIKIEYPRYGGASGVVSDVHSGSQVTIEIKKK